VKGCRPRSRCLLMSETGRLDVREDVGCDGELLSLQPMSEPVDAGHLAMGMGMCRAGCSTCQHFANVRAVRGVLLSASWCGVHRISPGGGVRGVLTRQESGVRVPPRPPNRRSEPLELSSDMAA
jgi:hypothetical protein